MNAELKQRITHEISNWRNAAQGGIEEFKSAGGPRNRLLRRVSVDCNGRRAGIAYWYCVVHRPARAERAG